MGANISQDASQDIINASVNRSHGITMIFTRRRNTGDNDHDIELNCQSIFFAWGRNTPSRNNKIKLDNPRYEDASENDTCFCPTVEATPMPSFNLTSIFMPTTDLCQSCRMVLNECNMNATCRQMRDARWKHCGNIFNWDELSNEIEPVCTYECKRHLVAFKKIIGEKISCCSCEINDEHEIPFKIRCLQIPKNIDRWCPNTITTRCSKCKQGCVNNLLGCDNA